MRLLYVLLALLLVSCSKEQSKLNPPHDLTCEYLQMPLVDIEKPQLAWINGAQEGERGQFQTAYRIKVATSRDQLNNPDLWDSGKVDSDQSIRVKYGGEPIQSRQECWWQVRVWDKDGFATAWSKPAFWRMGLLDESDWKAQWIGAPWDGEEHFERPSYPDQPLPEREYSAPLLRKEFKIDKEVHSAVAFVTGLGFFEFYVNGKKIGDDVLVPNTTLYGKRPKLGNMYIDVEDNFKEYRVMYLAYDITQNLKKGENAIGAILGNGFYNPAKFWCEGFGTTRFLGQFHITYSDGSEEVISSDESWKASKSPIVKNMLYYGETYDARLKQDGWNEPNFDDSLWKNVAIKKAPYGKLVAHTSPTDKVMEVLQPKSIEKLENGNYLVDFGKEISGWLRFNNLEAPAGHRVDITFDGNLYSGDNTYIFKGDKPENYAPRFNWFVFQKAEIKNWFGELTPEMLTAEAVYTDMPVSAEFETSNPRFNQINDIWRQSQLDNTHGGIASDCPHRERNGYTGDGQVACATVLHNFDAKAFYQKWIQDMLGAQNPETGYVPNGAPWQPGCGGGPAWGAAICIMPWEYYLHYGSIDMLEDNYEGMKEYIEYMKTWEKEDGTMFSKRKNGSGEILKWYNLGDWGFYKEMVSDQLVHTFYYWYCVDIAAKTAKVLGKTEEQHFYEQYAEKTKEAFHSKFFDLENSSYGIGGANVFALAMDVPEKTAALSALKQKIEETGYTMYTGIFGARFLFEVLSENGESELAYQIMNQTQKPSFGAWLADGATTTREYFDNHGSHNHPMFGGGLVWFYRNLAGIQPDEKFPGYKHIQFKPQPVADHEWVKYYNDTSYGRTGIEWAKENDVLKIQVVVPVGSTASIFVPAKDQASVSEKGNFEGVEFEEINNGIAKYEVQSGEYEFTSITN